MICMFAIAGSVFLTLFKVTAGYGQHMTKKWGPSINNKAGWVLMELPTMIYIPLYIIGNRVGQLTAIVFLLIWLLHYGQRTFIFPLLIRGKDKMPFSIIFMGMLFNGINAYLQGRWINTLSDPTSYGDDWLKTWQFIVGFCVFLCGYVINLSSDSIIRNLRKPGDNAFHIPHGGMFRFVSCPSYLGEIMEWIGWAILTWSMPGLVFVVWTFANLAPRAQSNHKWYLKTFEDYPKNRKALLPFLW
jgi:3-oxo-5-alpha-steroid 4-dehydrogenase 1